MALILLAPLDRSQQRCRPCRWFRHPLLRWPRYSSRANLEMCGAARRYSVAVIVEANQLVLKNAFATHSEVVSSWHSATHQGQLDDVSGVIVEVFLGVSGTLSATQSGADSRSCGDCASGTHSQRTVAQILRNSPQFSHFISAHFSALGAVEGPGVAKSPRVLLPGDSPAQLVASERSSRFYASFASIFVKTTTTSPFHSSVAAFCGTLVVAMSGEHVGGGGTGSAHRQGERRLRSFPRHERMGAAPRRSPPPQLWYVVGASGGEARGEGGGARDALRSRAPMAPPPGMPPGGLSAPRAAAAGGSHGRLRGCRDTPARRGAGGGARRARRCHRPVPPPTCLAGARC